MLQLHHRNFHTKTLSIQPRYFFFKQQLISSKGISPMFPDVFTLFDSILSIPGNKIMSCIGPGWRISLGQVWSCSSFLSKKKLGFVWPGFCQQWSVTGQDGGGQSCPVPSAPIPSGQPWPCEETAKQWDCLPGDTGAARHLEFCTMVVGRD